MNICSVEKFVSCLMRTAFFYIVLQLSMAAPSIAGEWRNSCTAPLNVIVGNTRTGGAGSAAEDLACHWPHAADIINTIYSGPDKSAATAVSWPNTGACVRLDFYVGLACYGLAQYYCTEGDLYTSDGMCTLLKNIRTPNSCESAGNPIVISTGRKVQDFNDWSSGGAFPLEFKRNYSSFYQLAGAPAYTRLGQAWRSNFDARAKFSLPNNVTDPAQAAEGSLVHIVLPSGNEYSFRYTSGVWRVVLPRLLPTVPGYVYWDQYREDLDVALSTTTDSVVMRAEDNTLYTFDKIGLLTKIAFSNGYQQFLSYVGVLNSKVTDSLGRILLFDYWTDSNKVGFLKSVTLPDGNKLLYDYLDPAATSGPTITDMDHTTLTLASVTFPDLTPSVSTDNPKQIFEYLQSVEFPYALTGYFDERGVRYATWAYDSSGRATSSKHDTSDDLTTFAYDDVNNKVTVTNALGRATVYAYQRNFGVVQKLLSVDGVATSNCAASNTTYAYNASGFRTSATDAEGRIKTWSRNSRGLPTSEIDGFGTALARTTTTTWDVTRALPTQISEPGLTTNLTYNSDSQISTLSQVDSTTTTVPYSTNGQTRTTAFGYTAFTLPPAPAIAATSTALANVNLTLTNANANLGNTSGWTSTTGTLTTLSSAPCTASACFSASTANYSTVASQDVAIPSLNYGEVDGGKRALNLSWKQNANQIVNIATLRAVFLNQAGMVIGTATENPQTAIGWTTLSLEQAIPALTRTIRIQIVMDRLTGSYEYAFIDDVTASLVVDGSASAKPFLRLTNPEATTSTTGWTLSSGANVAASTVAPCLPITCFAETNAGGTTTMSQTVAIPTDRYTEVDNGARAVDLRWIDQSSSDLQLLNTDLTFLNASAVEIANTHVTSPPVVSVNQWAGHSQLSNIPVGTRQIKIAFNFVAPSGVSPSSGYVTGLSARLVGRDVPQGSINLLTSVDGPLAGAGDKVTYAYDTKGNLSQITDEVGLISKILTVDAAGRPTSIQDENGINTSLAYDPRGRLTTITVNPSGTSYVTSLTYDAVGNVTNLTLPDGALFNYTWNVARRLTAITNNSGQRIDYTYNLNGDVTSSVTKSAALSITRQMTMAYDELGRLLRQVGATSQTTTLSYDRTDNLTQVKDPRNNLYGYAYDGLSRLVQTTDQQAAQVNVARDGQDEIVGYQDPRSIVTTYVRNGFGEVIQEVSPDAGTTTLTRDARGLITQSTDGRGVVANMSYDNAGRLLSVAYPAAVAENVTYSYDSVTSGNKGKGRLTRIMDESGSTSLVYNLLGQISSKVTVIGTKTYTNSYTYSQTGKLGRMTFPSGRMIDTVFSATRKITGVTTKQYAGATLQNVATGILFMPLSDLLNTMTSGNGLVTLAGYDLDYRLTSLNVKNGTTIIQGNTYAYGDSMNLTGITDTVTAANSNSLSYSPANRLASASGAWGNAAYSYDAVGNRLSDVMTGVANLNRQATFDSFSNRLTGMTENGAAFRTYTYDAAGNISTDVRPGESFAYSYNMRNRLAAVTRNSVAYATYTYNALEQLTTRTTSAAGGPVGTIHYLYDLDGHLIVEADAATGTTLREYIWLPANDNRMTTAGGRMGETLGLGSLAANDNNPPDLPLAIVDTVNTTPTLLMVHSDHLGRPTRLTDATKATVWQASYKPWGEVQSISGTVLNNLRLPGQYFQIETNLAYNHHRHYDPVTGRYTQPDPLRFVDGPSVYAYAGSSPFMNSDFLGLQTAPPPDGIPGGPWTWSSDPTNSRGGTFRGADGKSSATWDAPDGHWDVDNGSGSRQRYNRHGAPISPEDAHGRYDGPPRIPFVPKVGPWILIPDIPGMMCGLVPGNNSPICSQAKFRLPDDCNNTLSSNGGIPKNL